MVIHTVIDEYDLLYAQNREMNFALSLSDLSGGGKTGGNEYEPFSALSAEDTALTLKDKGDIIL
ncbi:MAG: hypothetical protein ACI4J6_04245 [Oscillospiraceae bacterium]